ncbi:reverse transcriptase domain-containing protein [Tanacetum coccineum]
MNATSSKTDERIDKLADQLSTLVEIVSKKVVTPAPVKAVEETCVTCGGAHSWYNCPATDNNQASVCATTGTYNQVNPPNRVSNQMAPPGFAPVQNNGQNRFNQNQVQGNNFNRGNNFHGNQGFQAQNNHALNFQNQGFQNQPFQVPNNQVQQEISNDFSSYKRNNDQMMRNMQNQINSLKGDLKNEIQNTIKSQQAVMMNQQTTFQNNLQNMICGLFQNQASTLGTLPSNTIPNPKGEMKAITTRSGVAYEGPSIPTNPSPKKESDVSKNLPKPNIPYPSRRDDQKSRDKASNQMEKIFQIFQDLLFDISFADALLLMPRFAPTIKSLLMNKEKFLELAKIPLNENCSAMVLKKLPEKFGDPGKFLIPCNFPGMDLADRSITRPKGLAEDIFVKVGNFHFPTNFVVVDFEADPRVPLILGRSFLRTSRALIDVYEGELVLRDGNEQITFHVDGTSKHPQKHINESIKMVNDSFSSIFAITSTLPSIEPKDSLIMGDEHLSTFSVEEIIPILRGSEDTSRSDSANILPLCDDLSSINVLRDDFMTFSNPLFKFDVNYNSSDVNPLFDKVLEDIECKDSYDSNLDESTFLVTPLSDSNKDECLAPGDDNDETDAFLAIEVPTYIKEGYFDSEGDVLYLESLLSDDTTHKLSPEVFFDHEPQRIENELDHDTFSPKSDHLHHEFAGSVITIPPRIDREHKDYISRMSLLCGNSSSQEEIDIFSRPDDSIPPGIESDFDSEEDIIDNLLNDDPIPEYERLTFDMEPDVPVINNGDELNEDECFDPGGGEINVEVDDSFTFEIRIFLPYLTYPEVSPLLFSTENEDTIFDLDIST